MDPGEVQNRDAELDSPGIGPGSSCRIVRSCRRIGRPEQFRRPDYGTRVGESSEEGGRRSANAERREVRLLAETSCGGQAEDGHVRTRNNDCASAGTGSLVRPEIMACQARPQGMTVRALIALPDRGRIRTSLTRDLAVGAFRMGQIVARRVE